MKTLNDLIQALWKDYSTINKQAHGIHQLLTKKGEKVINDHIAFRTFNFPKVNIEVLAQPFLKFGYVPKGEYEFPTKKLHARHYEHPDVNQPRVFISELKVEAFSPFLQKTVKDLVQQVDEKKTKQPDFVVSGCPWKPVAYDTYLKLKEESEYAGWMAVFGFRANHFTVLFNTLKSFKDLPTLDQFIKDSGYQLNTSGGEIKGTPKELLEQSSTMAHPVEVQFADKKATVPACYYEFARRYPKPDGKLFLGFIAESADKIFESTDNKKIN